MTERRHPIVRFLAWLGGHELGTLLTLAGILAGVFIFAELADQVVDGGTRQVDRTLLLAMRHPGDLTPLGPPYVQDAARDITALGGLTFLTLLTAGVCCYLLLDGRRNLALFIGGSIVSGQLLSTLLKDIFQRPRPHLVPVDVFVSSTSFPSGHSMLSAITYFTLGALLAGAHKSNLLKAYFLLGAALLTVLVGVSRVYLGVHWPSDVLAGWTAGAVWALFCRMVAERLRARHAFESGRKQDC